MRSLRSRSVKLLPSCWNGCCRRAATSRGTRVYAFSSVVPRKKLGIERAGKKEREREREVEKKRKKEHGGGTGLSSYEFDRFTSRSQDVSRSPTFFLCPLKRGISFRLKKGLVSSRFSFSFFFFFSAPSSDSPCYGIWIAAVCEFSKSFPEAKLKRLRIYLRLLKAR